MDKKLADIITALLSEAQPKTESTHKTVPAALLDQLSERMADLGR